MQKTVSVILLFALAGILLYGASDLPSYGSADAPIHRVESLAQSQNPGHYYVEHAYHDAHTPNFITVVLADYRAFDTLGETIVVLIAGLGCFLILHSVGKKRGKS